MFFLFMSGDGHSCAPCGEKMDERLMFEPGRISRKPTSWDPVPFDPEALDSAGDTADSTEDTQDPIGDTEFDDHEDPPTTPTIATCNLTALGTLFATLRVDELLETDPNLGDGTEIFPLNDEILPLLAESQFPGCRWDALRPVMQVASKLLQSPASEEYLYAALISRTRDVAYANQPSRTYRSIFRKDSPLIPKERKVIKLRLQQMAKHVTFSIADTQSSSVQGYCEAQEAKIKGIPGWGGVASNIVLNQDTFKQYCDLYDSTSASSAQGQKDHVQRLAFRLAKTTCHELAHAFHHARFPPTKISGIGFETQCISEHGFDWESCVFGGVISCSADHVELADWPCAEGFDHYCRAEHPLFVARLPEHDLSTDWKMSDAYVRSLFQPALWAQTAPDVSVPKVLGYRHIPCAERGACRCYPCQRSELLVQARIEGGNGDVDYEKLHKDTVALMRTLKQTTIPHPKILQMLASAAKEVDVASPDGAACPLSDKRTQDLDFGFWSEDPKDQRDESHELDEDLGQYEPYLYGDCDREAWGYYPYGRWDNRRHGASLDPDTFGVPDGYVSVLDGTLVRSDKADLARQWEEEDMEEDISKAGLLLDLWKKQQAEGFPGRSEIEKTRVRRLIPILSQMIASEDPVVRRMVSGIKEVSRSSREDIPVELEALRQLLL